MGRFQLGAVTSWTESVVGQLTERFGHMPIHPPFVTIVVTVYNYERYVVDCLHSISQQSYKHFKCIVVDDCSSDGSVAAIERFIDEQEPDSPFELVRHDSNVGQMAAFKTGLTFAEGEFLVYVDADDLLLPDFLSGHLDTHLKNIPVSFTSSDQYQINEHGEVIGGLHPDLLARGKYRLVFPHHVFSNSWVWATTSSMMFRRSVLELILPDNTEPFRRCADNYVCHFANMVGGSTLIPAIYGCYRRHGKNYFSNNRIVGGQHPTGDMHKHPAHETVRRTIREHLLRNREQFVQVLGSWPYLRLLSRSSTLRETIGVSACAALGRSTAIPRRIIPFFLLRNFINRVRWRLRLIFASGPLVKRLPLSERLP